MFSRSESRIHLGASAHRTRGLGRPTKGLRFVDLRMVGVVADVRSEHNQEPESVDLIMLVTDVGVQVGLPWAQELIEQGFVEPYGRRSGGIKHKQELVDLKMVDL